MEELYQAARHVLLDALEALGQHREAVILVGAQVDGLREGDASSLVSSLAPDALDDPHNRGTTELGAAIDDTD
jgi:hypothetical protein